MKVAVEGCCHGQLDATYKRIAQLEAQHGYKVDLLLICGDFQAIRNHGDLECMAVPDKYKALGNFYKYYTGEVQAPLLTIVIGGNHEASNYMWELYHGGWLAPKIYYLGGAGCIKVNGVRIAGASGIYNRGHDQLGHYETVPYDRSTVRSIYHIRQYDVWKLLQLTSPTVFLSHDWPQSIAHYGNLNQLLRLKPFFRSDIETGQLGSPPLLELLKTLKPLWWFAAHLHVKYAATFPHTSSGVVAATSAPVANPDEIEISLEDAEDETNAPADEKAVDTKPTPEPAPPALINPDEIILDDEVDDVQVHATVPGVLAPQVASATSFLALDKCLPQRQYLEILDIPSEPNSSENNEPSFMFDLEWLAITRAAHPFLTSARLQGRLPALKATKEMVATELEWVTANVGEKNVEIVQTFTMTAPGPEPQAKGKSARHVTVVPFSNPQTEAFCAMLQLPNKINPTAQSVTQTEETPK